jgi:acetyltransferase-like isoleucine patch superfamily enzyme
MFGPADTLHAGVLAEAMRGSPLHSAAMRLRGADVGARVFLDTLSVLDYDLTRVGDGACIGRGAFLMGHLGAPKQGAWLLTQKRVEVGAHAAVGPRCVLLPGFALPEGASLEPLSLAAPAGF